MTRDARQNAHFCEEFRDILYAPYIGLGTRDAADVAPKIQRILTSDPLWDEVYRADPRRTLALIQRIRDAGGLTD